MENSKDQILADFQSCTGIDDVGECIMHLEASNWNLLNAIHTVMPDDSQELPSERIADIPMELTNESSVPASGDSVRREEPKPENSVTIPMEEVVYINDGPSHPPPPRLLNFEVRYKEYMVPLEVPDSETVGAIKDALHMELGVPPCRQELCGWQRNHISDDTLLSSLQLPSLTNLFLSAPDPLSFASAVTGQQFNFDDPMTKKYLLHIIDTSNNKEYDLYFPGSKSVSEVKLGLRDVTNIPVRFQQWVGWPEAAIKDENVKLAALDLESPFVLILSRVENIKPKKQLVDLTSSESSENELEDAPECYGVDDEMFQASTSSKKTLPLIPDDIEDETTAICHFEAEFTNRYGPCHPTFFQGSLAEAIQASCNKPAKDRRPLVIYFHHDHSVLANVFCTHVLCSESITSYLALNFVTWAWDLTQEITKCRFLSSVSIQLGVSAASTIRNIPLDHLPALMIITKVRSTSEVLTVIPGSTSLDELMTRLVHAVDVFKNEITAEIREEDEREARELVKREQDAAYEASLMADRAKEEAKRYEEEKKQKEVKEVQRQKEEEENTRQQEEEMKKAIQKSLADQLPPEPEEDSNLRVSHIRIRLPNGIMMARRFLASEPLDLLLIYIASQGYPTENYKVLASWPRRDLTVLNKASSLEELKLYPKETVTLEER